MNKKKIIAIILLIVIGTVVFWKRDWISQKLGLKKEADSNDTNGSNNNNTNNTNDNNHKPVPAGITYVENDTFPFKLGDKGTRVKAIQIGLNRFHGAILQQDGYFGPQTEAALVKAGFGKTLEAEEVNSFLKK